uniref:Uncharacterized protein n=1 Tax=Oryza brachyantha TaxID=4533 RepID=J3M4Z4_ORYBR
MASHAIIGGVAALSCHANMSCHTTDICVAALSCHTIGIGVAKKFSFEKILPGGLVIKLLAKKVYLIKKFDRNSRGGDDSRRGDGATTEYGARSGHDWDGRGARGGGDTCWMGISCCRQGEVMMAGDWGMRWASGSHRSVEGVVGCRRLGGHRGMRQGGDQEVAEECIRVFTGARKKLRVAGTLSALVEGRCPGCVVGAHQGADGRQAVGRLPGHAEGATVMKEMSDGEEGKKKIPLISFP